jgi:hypothetical protein
VEVASPSIGIKVDGLDGNNAELISFWVSHDKKASVIELNSLATKLHYSFFETADVRSRDVEVHPVLRELALGYVLKTQSDAVLGALQPDVGPF